MKVALVERINSRRMVNKDQMGGYGIYTTIGTGLGAKFIEKQTRRNVPILALGYLAAIFLNHKHEVEVITDGRTPESDLTVIYSSIVESKTEIDYAKRLREETETKIGFVGPFASQKPELYDVADFIILGEPEEAAKLVAEGNIPKGLVHSLPKQNLDELPHPDWSAFPLSNYSYYPVITETPFVTIQASRGCNFRCNYCPYAAYYGNVRRRSVANVLGEIKELVSRYGIKGLYFRDPIFTSDRRWVDSFAEELIKLDLDIHWGCETRIELTDEQLVDKLYTAGLRAINCGIESSDNEVLQSADRRNTFTKIEKMIRYCEEKGIKVLAFYVFGLLSDTTASIEKTIQYAKKLNTFGAKFHINTPFPGTPFYQEVESLIFEKDWENFNSCRPVFKHPNLSSEELLSLKEKAYVSYYLRPSYILKHFRHIFKISMDGM